jgi:opacity protein-like surface antigen
MTNSVRRAAATAVLIMAATTVSAADNTWNGFYGGFNAGQATSHSCGSWSAANPSLESNLLAGLYAPNCGSHGAFLGGGQLGDNVQIGRLAYGVEAAFDVWEGSHASQSDSVSGNSPIAGAPPAGTYSFTSRRNPDVVGMFTGRVGYAGKQWYPYLKAGGLIAGGAQSDRLTYAGESSAVSIASFNGGKSFASLGWVAGGGAEIGLYGSWSLSAEYLHASLGKGSSSTAGCAGIAKNCAAFANTSLQNSHGSFEANLIRIGINYWFDYW